MSHFVVIVIGDDYEGQLAPYDENTEVPPYRKYADSDDLAWYKRVFVENNDGAEPESLEALAAWLSDRWGEKFLFEPQGGIYQMTTYNPKSKWDWYTMGGRWSGYFMVKEEAKSGRLMRVGEPGVFDNEPRHDADQCFKGDIDIEGMRDHAGQQAGERWDKAAEVFGDLPVATPWSDYVYRVSIDEARELYGAQPRVKALRESESLRWHDVEEFQVSRDEYVQRARERAIAPFAYVRDGEWFAPGKMGWFGMSDETELSKIDFIRHFNEVLDELPDNEILTAVDCHI